MLTGACSGYGAGDGKERDECAAVDHVRETRSCKICEGKGDVRFQKPTKKRGRGPAKT